MPISSPEVEIESVITSGFATLIANAATQIPLIFTNFPQDYINDTIAYLTDPGFKVMTVFGYAFDPAQLPAFNIILVGENESPMDRQMYVGDIVEAAANIPNTQSNESLGSDWSCAVSVIIRTEKVRQCIILYSILKWIFLGNRRNFEAYGMKANKFSGSDIAFNPTQPTQIFSRQLKVDCRIYNTVDAPVTGPTATTINSVVSGWPNEVTIEDNEEYLGGNG